ncbi:hypothetical protein ACH5RR_028019 [Cinchona calisaya]|uniref:Uncharacterized protein n=1 Tax=Cinchona calisaya TaxID=153742 RepID=A0ABD2YMK9_9GENT
MRAIGKEYRMGLDSRGGIEIGLLLMVVVVAVRGRNALNQPKENHLSRSSNTDDQQLDNQVWNHMEMECNGVKKEAVREEISRFNKRPSNSSYANHRLRVLNKILSLLSLQRTTSQDEELELLFAGISF